jgi:hypothetical protein
MKDGKFTMKMKGRRVHDDGKMKSMDEMKNQVADGNGKTA